MTSSRQVQVASRVRSDDDSLSIPSSPTYRSRLSAANLSCEFGLDERVGATCATTEPIIVEASNGDELLHCVSDNDLLDMSQMTWFLDDDGGAWTPMRKPLGVREEFIHIEIDPLVDVDDSLGERDGVRGIEHFTVFLQHRPAPCCVDHDRRIARHGSHHCLSHPTS